MEQNKEKQTHQWVTRADVPVEEVIREDLAIDLAGRALHDRTNQHVLTFPSIWADRSSLTAKAAEMGWSDARTAAAEATGYILTECRFSGSEEPVDVLNKVTAAQRAKGGLGANVYAPVGVYVVACKRDGNAPTITGALKAIRVEMTAAPSTPKSKLLASLDEIDARLEGQNKRTAVDSNDPEVRAAITRLYEKYCVPAQELVGV